MSLARFALAACVVVSIAARPDVGLAGERLIPFATNVDIEIGAEYVAPSFIDTSSCERLAVFVSGSGAVTHARLRLRIGIPDGGTIVRAGTIGVTANGIGGSADETGAVIQWAATGELIAPRVQPVLFHVHPSATMHVDKAWLYCKTQPLRR